MSKCLFNNIGDDNFYKSIHLKGDACILTLPLHKGFLFLFKFYE